MCFWWTFGSLQSRCLEKWAGRWGGRVDRGSRYNKTKFIFSLFQIADRNYSSPCPPILPTNGIPGSLPLFVSVTSSDNKNLTPRIVFFANPHSISPKKPGSAATPRAVKKHAPGLLSQ